MLCKNNITELIPHFTLVLLQIVVQTEAQQLQTICTARCNDSWPEDANDYTTPSWITLQSDEIYCDCDSTCLQDIVETQHFVIFLSGLITEATI